MELKLLLKRGGLITAANWQVVAIQFAAQATFQVLLAFPVIGAAILVGVLLGADLAYLLQGSVRDMFAAIARALMAEPAAFVAFLAAFGIVLLGGSVLMFLVKGGTVTVLLAANRVTGAIECAPITLDGLRSAGTFTVQRFVDGCQRLFRPYLALGLLLMAVYALSGAAYLAFVVFGYQAVGGRVLIIEWTLISALAAVALFIWITLVNLTYLLLQVAIASGSVGLGSASRAVFRFVRHEYRDLGGVFIVVFVMVVAATFVSALAWSGVGLIAFVPLVGLAVFPLQLLALLVRGLVFEYIGLTALGAYLTLYSRHLAAAGFVPDDRRVQGAPLGEWSWISKDRGQA